jgi:hypothetical protein
MNKSLPAPECSAAQLGHSCKENKGIKYDYN